MCESFASAGPSKMSELASIAKLEELAKETVTQATDILGLVWSEKFLS